MPSFSESIFLFFLALMLLGPKKLPALARELGKWLGEFRRASNEFKMQMEEEMRASEQADKDKKAEAIQATAPPTATPSSDTPVDPVSEPEPSYQVTPHVPYDELSWEERRNLEMHEPVEPEPIASSGEVTMMPPETGLPVSRTGASGESSTEEKPSSSEATHG